MEADFNYLIANLDQYLVWAAIIACLVIAILTLRWQRRKKQLSGIQEYLTALFKEAINQKASLDIKLKQSDSHAGIIAQISSISNGALNMQAQGGIGEEWHNKPVEVFLRLNRDNEPVFYVFDSVMRKISQSGTEFQFSLPMPEHVRVDKKRHFLRATPNPDDILMIAVWPVAPGRRLPRTTADAGHPAVAWKNGNTEPSVQIENISAGGVALKFHVSPDSGVPFDAEKKKQLICLIVYKSEKPVVFWSTGEIMNIRARNDSLAVGLEFTNWAIQNQGESEIHWTHNSPWQGARPIREWVKQLDNH